VQAAAVKLSEYNINRAAFHLGMNEGAQVPAGDMARFYEAVNRIPSEYFYAKVIDHLSRCDRAWDASEVCRNVFSTGQLAPSRTQRIFGDANRQIDISDPLNADNQYREIYLRETDRLAETLYVANYRRENVRRHAFERAGVEFIDAIPGPAATSVGTRILEATGGLGMI
jgi:hypothetical protein